MNSAITTPFDCAHLAACDSRRVRARSITMASPGISGGEQSGRRRRGAASGAVISGRRTRHFRPDNVDDMTRETTVSPFNRLPPTPLRRSKYACALSRIDGAVLSRDGLPIRRRCLGSRGGRFSSSSRLCVAQSRFMNKFHRDPIRERRRRLIAPQTIIAEIEARDTEQGSGPERDRKRRAARSTHTFRQTSPLAAQY